MEESRKGHALNRNHQHIYGHPHGASLSPFPTTTFLPSLPSPPFPISPLDNGERRGRNSPSATHSHFCGSDSLRLSTLDGVDTSKIIMAGKRLFSAIVSSGGPF
jgi:hypothetical protein